MNRKVIITQDELPLVNNESVSYALRYRIISQDKNRTSAWSPVFNIDAQAYIPKTSRTPSHRTITHVASGNIVSVTWESNDNVSLYDFWVKWNGDLTFTFLGQTSVPSFSFDKITTHGDMELYVSSSQIIQNDNFLYAYDAF